MGEKIKVDKEEAVLILDYNIKRLYKLSSKKYCNLYAVLHGELGDFLRGIINFWRGKDSGIYNLKQDTVYFLGTQMGTYKVRKKTTRGVTNKQINYLCAIGLLEKEHQRIEHRRNRRILRNLNAVSRKMLAYNYNSDIRPINTFKVKKYTTEFLLECNERARKLQENNITFQNMSYLQLALNGMKDIAVHVYGERSESEEKKLREYEILKKCIDDMIEEKGYTTKQEIYKVCNIDDKELDRLFQIFKRDIWESRSYKSPNRKEREKYGLKEQSWIIQKKTV